ncbi:hypothetical protein FZI97_14710, partial [Mycobacterium sp. CBMA360]|uniref:DUF5994 family protein n=2 Tax=Mycolicibacterium TaxID=1866885 RepID=UPI0013257362
MTNTPCPPVATGDNSHNVIPDSTAPDRLRLAVQGTSAEHFDGTWWPSSTTLTRELETLLPAVHEWLGIVAAVGYRIDDWTDTPPQVDA